jgi:peptide chain release factor subunit 1
MGDLDRGFLKKLAGWKADGHPVSSFYLDVDGRRYPRRQDYLQRAEALCHGMVRAGEALGRHAKTSVCRDTQHMLEVVGTLDRGGTRGVALFSSAEAGLWEEVLVPRPIRDRATLSDRPYLLPLEAVVQTSESFCTVLVDREKARIFLARMGRIAEETDVFDEVPGQHDQGGWAQARYQRHIEEVMGHHLKHVALVLMQFFKRRGFDHLILAGPEELIPEFERGLHDYLRRRVIARIGLAMNASPSEVLARSQAIEEEVEAEAERRVIERLESGHNAVRGLSEALVALNEGRVQTLVVPFGASREGLRCTSCERLAVEGSACATCGGPLERVADIVEHAVASALRQGSRVETIGLASEPAAPADGADGVGALLRY